MSDQFTASPTAPDGAASRPGTSPQLQGRMGPVELALTVLAFAAPLASVVGVLPLVIIFGGVGAPLAFVAASAVLLLFSVGFTTMSRFLSNPGAFYAYISAGINKTFGLAASFLAMLGYVMVGLGVAIFFGIVAQDLVSNTFSGPVVPTWVYSLLLVAGVAVFGYLRIDLSAKVLSLVMVLEIGIVLIFDAAVFADGGPEGRSLAPFAWSSFSNGSVGVAILFAVITYLGFEATAVFREETRDPLRTIPRATYMGVTLIGVFYVITTWLLIIAFGVSQAPGVAAESAPTMFTDAMGEYVGVWAGDVISVLVVTSAFAAVLSCHNIVARYCHSLGVDGALPAALGRVHHRHGSPHRSSIVVSVVFGVTVLAFAGSDPIRTYTWMAGAGGFPLLLLMFMTSIAVVLFFRRNPDRARESTPWHTLVAPVLALIGLGASLYLSATNFVDVTGGDAGTALILQVVIWAVFALGLAVATFFRLRRPSSYARIGRQPVA